MKCKLIDKHDKTLLNELKSIKITKISHLWGFLSIEDVKQDLPNLPSNIQSSLSKECISLYNFKKKLDRINKGWMIHDTFYTNEIYTLDDLHNVIRQKKKLFNIVDKQIVNKLLNS